MIRSATLVLALATTLVVAAPVSTAASQSAQRDTTLELAVVQGINAVRAEHGLRPLKVSKGLRNAAAAHTRSLALRGLFQHESADGTTFDRRVRRSYPNRGYESWTVGENLVFGSAPFTADDAVQTWLDSPPHRRNMLDPTWREVGVGAVVAQGAGGVYGGDTVVIVTADFGARAR